MSVGSPVGFAMRFAPWRRIAETEWGLHTHRLLLGHFLHVIVFRDEDTRWRWVLLWNGGPEVCPDCFARLSHCGHEVRASPMSMDSTGYRTLKAAKLAAEERMRMRSRPPSNGRSAR